jgi:hypothetical protein
MLVGGKHVVPNPTGIQAVERGQRPERALDVDDKKVYQGRCFFFWFNFRIFLIGIQMKDASCGPRIPQEITSMRSAQLRTLKGRCIRPCGRWEWSIRTALQTLSRKGIIERHISELIRRLGMCDTMRWHHDRARICKGDRNARSNDGRTGRDRRSVGVLFHVHEAGVKIVVVPQVEARRGDEHVTV